jgi:hypothetical protein
LIVYETTKKQAKNIEIGKYPKLISDQHDIPQSWLLKNQKVKGKRTLGTKDRAQECIEDT